MGDWPNRFKDLSDVTTSTAGPPTTGFWDVASVSVDTNGTLWVCTAAGTPGTWVAATGNELAYAAITAGFSTTSTTLVDVTGLSIGVTVGSRPILIEVFAAAFYNATANDGASVAIVEGTTTQASAGTVSGIANNAVPLTVKARLTPSAGVHTYKVQASVGAFGVGVAGTMNIQASPTFPAFIQAKSL